jgi:PAS domain-containing protein
MKSQEEFERLLRELQLHQVELERQNAELRKAQAMLARTEQVAQLGSWEWDVATDTVTWSEELFRMFQCDPAKGAPSFVELANFYSPADYQRLQDAVQAAVLHFTPYELELCAIRTDGEKRVFLTRGHAVKGSNASAKTLFGSSQDITERKQAENALRTSHETLRGILKTTLDGYWCVNAKGKILDVNQTYCQQSGYTREELLTMQITDLDIMVDEDLLRTGVKKLSGMDATSLRACTGARMVPSGT